MSCLLSGCVPRKCVHSHGRTSTWQVARRRNRLFRLTSWCGGRSVRVGIPRPRSPSGRRPFRSDAWTRRRRGRQQRAQSPGHAGKSTAWCSRPRWERSWTLTTSGVRSPGRHAGRSLGCELDASRIAAQLRLAALRWRYTDRVDLSPRWTQRHVGDRAGLPPSDPARRARRCGHYRPAVPRFGGLVRQLVRQERNQAPSVLHGWGLTCVGDTGIEPVTPSV